MRIDIELERFAEQLFRESEVLVLLRACVCESDCVCVCVSDRKGLSIFFENKK